MRLSGVHLTKLLSWVRPSLSNDLRSAFFRRLHGFCTPLVVALTSATVVFFGSVSGKLTFLSANSDNPYWGYDFFNLPRCGLALVSGLDVADSAKRVSYGPWSTDWASHPLMCLLFGAPLGHLLSPRHAYLLASAFYFALHLFCLAFYLRRSQADFCSCRRPSQRALHLVFALLVGGFAPFIVIYHYGQYHALSVLALFLLMQGTWAQTFGFVLSALTKPLLAPAGVLLLVRKCWRQVSWILLFSALGTVPWVVLDGLGVVRSTGSLGASGFNMLRYSVPNWAQEVSMAKPLEGILSPQLNFYIRLVLGILQLFSAGVIARRGDLKVAFGVAVLVFFTIYARGHEYHAVTLVPYFLYLFVERGKRHRNVAFLVVVGLFALPTSYALLVHVLGGNGTDIATMKESSALLGWLFVLQRPVAVISLWVYIMLTEMSWNAERELDRSAQHLPDEISTSRAP